MHRKLLASVPLLLLNSLVTAQDPTAAAPSSPLVVRTSSPMYATMLQRMFDGAGGRMAKPAPGTHHLLTLDDGGVIVAATGQGEIEGLEVDARVSELAKMFAAEMQQARMQAEAMAGMAGSMGGGGPELGKMVGGFFALPAQIEQLKLRTAGNPMQIEEGFQITLDLQPVAGTPFAMFAAAMKPNRQGAPAPATADAMLAMRFGLETAGLAQLSDLMMPLVSAMGGMQGKEWQGLMREMVGLYDGTGSMTMDFGGGGMSMVMGLTDGAKMAEIMTSERYRTATQAALANNPMFVDDPQFTTEDHRGVKVFGTSVEMDERMAAMNPMFGGESSMNTFGAVAGNWLLNSVMASDMAGVRALVDAALDKKITRAPLPGGALLTIDIAIGQLADMFGGAGGEAPEGMSMSLARSGAGLVLQAKIQ